jgi:hypothetical protein
MSSASLLAGAPSVGVLVEDLGERMGHARAGDACAEVLAGEVSADLPQPVAEGGKRPSSSFGENCGSNQIETLG